MQLPRSSLLALLPYFLQVQAGASGTGTTTRYWDCCKPSCAWSGKTTLAAGATPVETCDINDSPLTDVDAVSGCSGGNAYMCSNESPWAISDDLSYGYAAVNIAGGTEESWCCACYELTFTSGSIAGKKMVVQATNTGGDLGSNQFDISMPGGGVGIFNGCTTEWGAPSSGWGAQYGGILSNTCSSFPSALQAGCNWRFDWFEGSDNPTVSFTQVECPAAITANSKCIRADDSSNPAASMPSETTTAESVVGTSTSVRASSSSMFVSLESASTSAVETTFAVETTSVESSAPIYTSSAVSKTMSSEEPTLATTSAIQSPTKTSSAATETASEADDVCEL